LFVSKVGAVASTQSVISGFDEVALYTNVAIIH